MSGGADVYEVAGVRVSLLPFGDSRDWARRILAQFVRGEKRSPTVYRMAHEAFGLPLPAGLRA
jgi:hypothetical protein